ncbi:tetratricopeptide repeat protein [Succiniclasticum ruminis]|uniref:Tetratricopeptide repeat-containing protein n=1 Tax=Succiniclasticum ruminis DSM 9236 TaxID=1123323 RepID=A0A1I1YD84_9FIRM|nr:tetratricopeptide repeat protein [Succiniclasticum ruminis]SFE17526.1 Tetratricopeptide repeat-containing protein [Succiniclasticum ruminis DSM 9236]
MKRNSYQLSNSQKQENTVKSKIGFSEPKLYGNHPDTINNLQDRVNKIISCSKNAISLSNAGMQDNALRLQRMVLVRQKEIFDEYHPNTIIAMNNLAVILLKSGQYEKALDWQQRVFKNRRIILGENHPNTINAKKKMANTIVRMNQKAIELSNAEMFKDALKLQQSVYDKQIELFDENHPNTIIAMSNLAEILLKLRQYEKALALQQKVFNNRKAVLGEKHPRTVLSEKNIKNTFATMNLEVTKLSNEAKYDEALMLQLTILNNAKKIFGEEHPETIFAKYNEILLLTQLKKRYNEALKLYESDLIKADPAIKFPPCPLVDSINIFDFFSECKQSDIITASPRKSFFVDAGPGTGKTYTLIQKLNYMVTQEGVEADGILVLCFTNAAVDEIRFRLKQFVANGADRSLVLVDVRTFHSFAWWLINEANSELIDSGWDPVNMASLYFEKSLVYAKKIFESFGQEVVARWEYFIVDEIQDLTNTLGNFVLEIINACLSVGCGVSVLGDACQAIYDYQESQSNSLKSGEFYKTLFPSHYR